MDSSLQTHLLGHWVRDRQEFTLEDAVHRITQLPAQAWGFDDRGVLAVGKAADVNVFDPETVSPDMPKLVHDLPAGAPACARPPPASPPPSSTARSSQSTAR
ncbi:amidohydrolase family protein [Candidatus Poriferisodalis sp.]|uniref:amidohydrolase family protein n=1 Tax=Candidatus Poriferisodalis sp. TaxID=3101277 RepID=UPI003B012DB1